MILTVQLGGFSNFIGSHWWNIQESTFVYREEEANTVDVDHDIFFRQGLSRKNEMAYNPRLLVFDLKGSLGSYTTAEDVNLQELQQNVNWDGKSEVYASQGIAKNTFLKELDSSGVRGAFPRAMQVELEKPDCVWTDFLSVDLHPQTITLLSEFQHNSTIEPFDVFPLGTSVLDKDERRETTEDRIRRFVEECDYLQGFQILVDAHNGFSGLASRMLQHLTEEYSTKSKFSYPVLPTATEQSTGRMERLTNSSLLMTHLFEDSSMICPISLDPSWASTRFRKFGHLKYQPYLPYHEAAIIATALDTATLPMRRKRDLGMSMSELEHSLVFQGCKAVGISCALPIAQRVKTPDSLKSLSTTELIPLTPAIDRFHDCRTQSLAWRGIGEPDELQPVVEQWSSSTWGSAITANTIFRSPCPSHAPYPQYFADNIGKDGFYSDHAPASRKDVSSFATVSGFHSSPQMGESLKQLHSDLSRFNVKKLHRYIALGMEEDDLVENRYLLEECGNRYQEL